MLQLFSENNIIISPGSEIYIFAPRKKKINLQREEVQFSMALNMLLVPYTFAKNFREKWGQNIYDRDGHFSRVAPDYIEPSSGILPNNKGKEQVGVPGMNADNIRGFSVNKKNGVRTDLEEPTPEQLQMMAVAGKRKALWEEAFVKTEKEKLLERLVYRRTPRSGSSNLDMFKTVAALSKDPDPAMAEHQIPWDASADMGAVPQRDIAEDLSGRVCLSTSCCDLKSSIFR